MTRGRYSLEEVELVKDVVQGWDYFPVFSGSLLLAYDKRLFENAFVVEEDDFAQSTPKLTGGCVIIVNFDKNLAEVVELLPTDLVMPRLKDFVEEKVRQFFTNQFPSLVDKSHRNVLVEIGRDVSGVYKDFFIAYYLNSLLPEWLFVFGFARLDRRKYLVGLFPTTFYLFDSIPKGRGVKYSKVVVGEEYFEGVVVEEWLFDSVDDLIHNIMIFEATGRRTGLKIVK